MQQQRLDLPLPLRAEHVAQLPDTLFRHRICARSLNIIMAHQLDVGMNERIAQSGQRLNVTAPDVFDPEAFPANAHKEPVHLPLGKLPCQLLELSVRTADEHDPPLLSRNKR